MDRKRVMLIINPISGTLNKDGLADRVRERLEPAGFEIEVVMTEREGHGRELASKAVEECYYGVIAAGGDGTVNEIATALRSSNCIMGVIPLGSGNGLARHIYGSIDLDRSIDIIARDFPQDCDYGSVNGQPFFCTFGLGFDAIVSKQFADMPTRGLITYIKSALQEYVKYSPTEYEIITEGRSLKVKAFIVAVCNASQYGNNAFIAPQASMRDGLLDIVIIHSGNPLTRAFAGVELFTGRLDKNLLIQSLRVREATIKHLPGFGHIDGNPLMTPETLRIECHKGDLRIFYDPDKPPFRRFITPIESLSADSTFLVKENARIALKNIKESIEKIFNDSPDTY